MADKLEGYINIAIKAGKVVFGQDAICAYNKKMYGIVLCRTASVKTQATIERFCAERGLGLCITAQETRLCDLTHRENNKVIAITNKDLYNKVIEYSGKCLNVLK